MKKCFTEKGTPTILYVYNITCKSVQDRMDEISNETWEEGHAGDFY